MTVTKKLLKITRIEFKWGVICKIFKKKNQLTVLFHMGVERCIHRSLHVALKVHQIDAFNFNI